MKNKLMLPKKSEIAIVAVLCFILAAIATTTGQTGPMLAFITVPLFFTCAMVGLSRSHKRVPVRQEARIDLRNQR